MNVTTLERDILLAEPRRSRDARRRRDERTGLDADLLQLTIETNS